MMRRLLLLSLVAAVLPTGLARADEIVRKGFTLALTVGPGGASLFPSGGGSSTEPGIGGAIALGGFLTPKLALLGRASGVGYFTQNNIDAASVGVAGPALEYWLSDHLNVFGGIGIGFSNIKPKGIDAISKPGFGVMLGGHWFPFAIDHHGIGVYVELEPVFLAQNGGSAFLYHGGFAWQYY